MNKIAVLLVSVLLLSLALSGCGENSPAVASNVKPPVDYQNIAPAATADSGNAPAPLPVLAEQLIANPGKYIGQTVSFGGIITEAIPGCIILGNIKALTNEMPGGAKVMQGAEVSGVCQGLVDGFVVLTESVIIPYCEVT